MSYEERAEATLARRLMTKLRELGILGADTVCDLEYPSLEAIEAAEEASR